MSSISNKMIKQRN